MKDPKEPESGGNDHSSVKYSNIINNIATSRHPSPGDKEEKMAQAKELKEQVQGDQGEIEEPPELHPVVLPLDRATSHGTRTKRNETVKGAKNKGFSGDEGVNKGVQKGAISNHLGAKQKGKSNYSNRLYKGRVEPGHEFNNFELGLELEHSVRKVLETAGDQLNTSGDHIRATHSPANDSYSTKPEEDVKNKFETKNS